MTSTEERLLQRVERDIATAERRKEAAREEMHAAQAELDELQIVRRRLVGYLSDGTEKLTGRSEAKAASPSVPPAPHSGTSERFLAGARLSIADACVEVLHRAGKPLHIAEIASRVLDAGQDYDGDVDRLTATVGKVLSRKGEYGRAVVRTDKGVYGLEGWGKDGLNGEGNLFENKPAGGGETPPTGSEV